MQKSLKMKPSQLQQKTKRNKKQKNYSWGTHIIASLFLVSQNVQGVQQAHKLIHASQVIN